MDSTTTTSSPLSFDFCMNNAQTIGYGGILIKGGLSEPDQIKMYRLLMTLAKGTEEDLEMDKIEYSFPWPFAFYNQAYIKDSNCREPTEIFTWAKHVWDVVYQHVAKDNSPPDSNKDFNIPKDQAIDSMYSQLYFPFGKLDWHKDVGLAWGMSVSLGTAR